MYTVQLYTVQYTMYTKHTIIRKENDASKNKNNYLLAKGVITKRKRFISLSEAFYV